MMVGGLTRSGSRLAVVVAAVVLLIAGCSTTKDSGEGGGGGQSGDKVIALLLPETKTTRYEAQDRPNFERRVKELCPDCKVIYSNADQDPAKQQDQAESAITNGAKVIVISAVDVKSAGSIAARAKQSQVGMISYGRLISDADLDYYVSIDPFKVGQQQGESLLKALKDKGKDKPSVVMINGAPTDSRPSPRSATAASTASTWPTTAWPAAPSPPSRGPRSTLRPGP
jgi:D-xylose transport system substrate-binding protein